MAYVYSGKDYFCYGCKKIHPLMVFDSVFQKGERMLFLLPHDKDDGTPCVQQPTFVSMKRLIPNETVDV
jgi:hypothetical protein